MTAMAIYFDGAGSHEGSEVQTRVLAFPRTVMCRAGEVITLVAVGLSVTLDQTVSACYQTITECQSGDVVT